MGSAQRAETPRLYCRKDERRGWDLRSSVSRSRSCLEEALKSTVRGLQSCSEVSRKYSKEKL